MEKEILLKLAEAYQTYDASVIEAYLVEDMHYASMWVFHEMTSKEEYLDYLTGKLQTMKQKNTRMEFEIVQGEMHEYALLVTNQKSPEGGNIGFVADFNTDGKVKMLNITIQSFFLHEKTMLDFFRKKAKYNVLPDKGISYAISENGEPMLTFYRPNSGLFCSTPLSEDDIPYFLNIRRPIIMDVENVAPLVIPNDLPSECDGIIFKNYGKFKITAFFVKNKDIQSMCFG